MSSKEKSIWMAGFAALMCVALIFGFAIKSETEKEEPKERIVYEFDNPLEEKKEIKNSLKKPVEIRVSEEETESSEIFEGLGYEEFWSTRSYGHTWDECAELAEYLGIDEYHLRISAGWTVNEGYAWCDEYLCYLCQMCCWYWYFNGDLASGLAGWDCSGMYDESRLYELGYYISQEEIDILWMALKYPYFDVFGCDGVSWYHNYPYYSSDGINVWK